MALLPVFIVELTAIVLAFSIYPCPPIMALSDG
jgi:hypothetical protein